MTRSGFTHLFVNQLTECALHCRHSRAVRRQSFAFSQSERRWGAFAEIAGFNDDAAFGSKEAIDGFHRGSDITRIRLHQNRAPPAEQRHRVRFLNEPRRITCELIAFDACQGERIIGIINQHAHQRVRRVHEPNRRQDRIRARSAVAGSGLAIKRSTSEALMAVMAPQQISRAGYEIRRKPRLDIVRDFLGGTVFGVAQARARPRNVAPGPGYCGTIPVRRFDL